MQIPEGWRAAIVTPDGTVADTVDLGGYDLTRALAALDVGHEIDNIVRRAE